MTPVTLIIDRTFDGVGRIKLRCGTTLPAVRRKLNRMLDALANEGRIDLLRAVRDLKVSLMELHDYYQRNALHAITDGASARPLTAAWLAWIEQKDCTAAHKRSLAQSLRHLRAKQSST